MGEPVWYYTTGHALDEILAGGAIPVTEEPALMPPRKLVWLSTHPDWEQACNGFIRAKSGLTMPLTLEQNDRLKNGLFRMQVPDANLRTWEDFEANEDMKLFAKSTRDRGGNPKRWRFSESPIGVAQWLKFQRWNRQAGEWADEPYCGNQFIDMAAEMLLCAADAEQSQRTVPALVLIYSLIDTMGWLAIPDLTSPTNSNRFQAWVEKHMKPSASFPAGCTAVDLYGARCGLLHTRTPSSGKKSPAKPLLYAWGSRSTADLQTVLDQAGSNGIPVHATHLFNATVDAVENFKAYLGTDRKQAVIVRQKAGTMLPTGAESLRADQRRNDVLEAVQRAESLGS